MVDLRAYQPSFTGGELSPALGARVDLAKYPTGMRQAVNLFIHPHGGVSNRAGLQFIGEVKDSDDNCRLVPFQFNTEQSYILEFGDEYFRVWRDGGIILDGLVPYEVETPYAHTDVADLVYIQDADVMYITHPDYPVHKLSRLADDDWTLTEVDFAPAMAAPTGLDVTAYYQRTSGVGTATNFQVTSVTAGGAESVGSTAVSVSITNPQGDGDGRLYRFTWTPVTGAASYRLYRTSGSPQGFIVETTRATAEIAETNVSGVNPQIPGVADVGSVAAPTGVAASIIYGKELSYKVSAVSEATGEESLPSTEFTVENDLSFQGNRNVIFWDAVAGASGYIIYREDNGVYGYIGRSETTDFTDDNIVADISDTPQIARNPFEGTGNYPRCVTFIEQRLAFASTTNDPQAVWMSQSANYENFGYSSPAKASDAVTFRVKSRQINEIRGMIALKGLMLLTSGAEWVVSGGSQSDAITPSSIKIDNQGYRGAARVQPIVVGNTVLFAQARGGVIRDFSYEFAQDSFVGKDLTVLARHLFEGKEIKAWGYAQAPYSVIWVVLDDGSLVSLTYMKEHEVWGWTRHQSGAGAVFEDVAVIAEGTEDVPYFLVRRTIDGTTKRYIEQLHTRAFDDVEDAFFVDCGLTYTGSAATIITGLDHLEGEEVVALANGNVVRGLTVGTVTGGIGVVLPNAATKVHVGLPMDVLLETLNLDLGQVNGLGTVQGRTKSVPTVTLRVEKTRGIFVGPYDDTRDGGKLVEDKQRSTEAWNEAIGLYTGDREITTAWDWNTNGRTVVRQFDPLPMTILALMPDVKIGG
jgi:hypothetical protein